jgi:hypothetical protein
MTIATELGGASSFVLSSQNPFDGGELADHG